MCSTILSYVLTRTLLVLFEQSKLSLFCHHYLPSVVDFYCHLIFNLVTFLCPIDKEKTGSVRHALFSCCYMCFNHVYVLYFTAVYLTLELYNTCLSVKLACVRDPYSSQHW